VRGRAEITTITRTEITGITGPGVEIVEVALAVAVVPAAEAVGDGRVWK